MKAVMQRGARANFHAAMRFYRKNATTSVAMAFAADLDATSALLLATPLLGSQLLGKVRKLEMRRFPYELIYFISGDDIRIIAVAHEHRQQNYWVGRK